MPGLNDFPARGRVKAVKDGNVIFLPSNTTYELSLRAADAPITEQTGRLVSAEIRVAAGKIYTVPSGGGFITPIYGTPRIIQGRIVHIEGNVLVMRAGTYIIVELPKNDDAIDLSEGAIKVGSIVNVVAEPGASIALAPALAPV